MTRKIEKIKEFIHFYLNPYYWVNPFFISFVEEMTLNPNPKYKGYIGGRIEIYNQRKQYDINEYRFLTKDIKEFYEFRDKWDFRDINWFQLQRLRRYVEKHFYVSVP